MEFRGKTAFITGSALRIGRALALDLSKRGVKVIIHYRNSRRAAVDLQKEIVRSGGRAELLQADFGAKRLTASLNSIRRIFKKKKWYPDILINNASIFYPTPLPRVSDATWNEFLSSNLSAPFLLAKEFGLQMKKRGSGKIINLIDWTVFQPPVHYLPYIVSKAGLWTATQGLAKELAPSVQVNAVAPGPILPSKGMTAQGKRKVTEKTLLKRFGSVQDIAAAVRFLIESDYITGICVPVDGGSLAAL